MRKAVFLPVGLVALGWLLFVVGFGKETTEFKDFSQAITGKYRYSWWMVILVTPIMLIMAVFQAAINRNKFIMNLIGAITTLLSALFLTALGFLLNFYGTVIDLFRKSESSPPAAVNLQFSGVLIAGTFWVILHCISNFYECEDNGK